MMFPIFLGIVSQGGAGINYNTILSLPTERTLDSNNAMISVTVSI